MQRLYYYTQIHTTRYYAESSHRYTSQNVVITEKYQS